MPSGVRRAAALIVLGALALAELREFRLEEFRRRVRALPAFAAVDSSEGILHGSGFAFDRRYAAFLDAIRRATPPGSTVAIGGLGPADAYRFSAAYLLAPRRVVGFDRLTEAGYAAIFGSGGAPGPAGSWPIPFGSMGRLR